MSQSEPTILDAFLEADSTRRRAVLGSESRRRNLIQDLEKLVGSDAARVIDVGRAIVEALDDEATMARTLRAITTAQAYLGRHDQAILTALDARRRARSAGDDIEAARALVAAMHPRCESGLLDEAIEGGETARRELLEAGAADLAIRVDLNLGNIRKMQGKPRQALEHLDRVISALVLDDPIRPHALNALGECHFVLDDLRDADSAFEESLRLLGEDGGLATAIVTGNRADVASREGRLEEAIDLFTEARRRCEDHGAVGHAARLTVESGDALESAGLLDEATQQIESVLDSLEASDMRFEHARALMILARIDLVSRRFESAVERADLSSRRFLDLGNRRLSNRSMLIAIESCIAARRLESAESRLAVLVDDDHEPVTRLGRHSMEAELHVARVRWPEAIISAKQACSIATELRVTPLSIECESRLARIQIRGGRRSEGIRTARKAVELIERIRMGFGANRIRSSFLASRTAAYESLVEGLIDSGDADSIQEAFEVMERSRNRGLVERTMERFVDSGSTGNESESVVALRRRLLALYAALDPNGLEDQRRARMNVRQDEIDAIEIELDRLMLGTEGRRPSIDATMSFEEVAGRIPADTALIEYFVADGRLLVFTILGGVLKVVDTGITVEDISKAVTELHFQCRRRLRGDPGPRVAARMHLACEAVLRSLHRQLVDPLPSSVRSASRWLLIPHGPLSAIPFHALLSDDGYVLDRTVITTASSAAMAIRLASTRVHGEGVVVATVSDERAPLIQDEGDNVAAFHRDVTRLDGKAATADAVLAGLSRARVAHLACHGRFLPGSPRSSGLRLADRWVTVRDIRELPATPSVVILSGCETGLHPQLGANEILGLARAFATRGTRTVVASLWSAHDSASTSLMTSMHAAIAEAVNRKDVVLGHSLAEAQKSLRAQRPHPAYWASFFCAEPCLAAHADSQTSSLSSEAPVFGEHR
ncbi:MAG: hypothetical protein CMJ23_13485 [Phycisphaerae bacterium]|nr:hypothetical protein [Phycisphaerae bacterium]